MNGLKILTKADIWLIVFLVFFSVAGIGIGAKRLADPQTADLTAQISVGGEDRRNCAVERGIPKRNTPGQ